MHGLVIKNSFEILLTRALELGLQIFRLTGLDRIHSDFTKSLNLELTETAKTRLPSRPSTPLNPHACPKDIALYRTSRGDRRSIMSVSSPSSRRTDEPQEKIGEAVPKFRVTR